MANNPALWDKNSPTPKSMRPPNMPPAALLNKQDKPGVAHVLNVEAVEFFPQNYKPPSSSNPAPSALQSRLNVHRRPQPEFVSSYDHTAPFLQNGDSTLNDHDLTRFHQIIDTLTKDPGQFDDLHELFLDTLFPYIDDDIYALTYVANVLVEQAIRNQSFRYNGAKLCYHLEQCSPNFRAHLHLTCKRELQRNSSTQSVLLFIAELYTQLHYQNIYGDLVIDCIKNMLAIGGNDNVKCLCQALKLTGYSLEKFNKDALDDVFKQLQAIKSSVTGSALILVNSVLALRQQQWGHVSGDLTSSNEELSYYREEDVQNTVFFNSDGLALSNEETEFLASNMNYTDEFNGQFDPDELCDPEPEMDEEIQEAFKEFVKISKRKH